MKMQGIFIAACGFNCALCAAFQGYGSPCSGCNSSGVKQKHCEATCVIFKCDKRKNLSSGYCYECNTFPCSKVRRIDGKYKRSSNTSLIENLNYIKKYGMNNFLLSEHKKWSCKACGEIVCIHKKSCLHCGQKWY